ncbi:DUF4124 domain-containing protein [Pseudomonadota bacterium]
MKSTIISMIIVLIVMMVVPMFLFGDGDLAKKFGFGGGGSASDSIQDLKARLPQNVQSVTTDKKVDVYKWVDEHGVTQFSQTPPFEGGESEKMVLAPNTNVVDAIKIPEEEIEVAAQPQVFSLGNPYTPGGAKELLDQSMQMQEQINQRQADQDKMMQEMMNGVFNKK